MLLISWTHSAADVSPVYCIPRIYQANDYLAFRPAVASCRSNKINPTLTLGANMLKSGQCFFTLLYSSTRSNHAPIEDVHRFEYFLFQPPEDIIAPSPTATWS